MHLTENFSLQELTKSQTAERKKIDNTPTQEVIDNLKELCENVLEKVRAHFKRPVMVNSGYRCQKLNKAIGGAKNSQHITGNAADLEIPGLDNKVVFDWIRDNLDFDQLILERYKPGIPDSGWVHVSWNSKKNRKQTIMLMSTLK